MTGRGSSDPGPAVRVYPEATGAAARLGRRVDLGLVGGPAGHGEAVEAPATTSMPAHPGSAPTAAKEALAVARALRERAENARAEREAVEVAADRALERARPGGA